MPNHEIDFLVILVPKSNNNGARDFLSVSNLIRLKTLKKITLT